MKRLLIGASFTLISLPVIAGGPTGIGDLQIGSSKAQVEALPASGGVHLVAPLTPHIYKYVEPTPGESHFKTRITTPWSRNPLEATLTFSNDILINIYVALDDSRSMLDQVKNQISEKYGDPNIDDKMEEKQCLYKNGANFKIKSGTITQSWIQSKKDGKPIESKISEGILDTCPTNLRHDSIGAIKVNSLSIGFQKAAPSSSSNPF